MERFYSNGKLLLTGEYFILEGAQGLAVPTKFGQDLVVNPISDSSLIWKSLDENGNCWFECVFELPKLRLVSADFYSLNDGGNDVIAENLAEILQEIKNINPDFLSKNDGVEITTGLTFPREWGLGTSSTLINNLSQFAQVNPYELLNNTFGGSGYDIACAKHNSPIVYAKIGKMPLVEKVDFNPSFKDQLYFVYLNQKQNSRAAIKRFNESKSRISTEINDISNLTKEILKSSDLNEFEFLIKEHELIISRIIQNKPIQEIVFSDYFGQTKSLGAWGGDFILATGNEDSTNYFKQKGFETVIPYSKMVL